MVSSMQFNLHARKYFYKLIFSVVVAKPAWKTIHCATISLIFPTTTLPHAKTGPCTESIWNNSFLAPKSRTTTKISWLPVKWRRPVWKWRPFCRCAVRMKRLLCQKCIWRWQIWLRRITNHWNFWLGWEIKQCDTFWYKNVRLWYTRELLNSIYSHQNQVVYH